MTKAFIEVTLPDGRSMLVDVDSIVAVSEAKSPDDDSIRTIIGCRGDTPFGVYTPYFEIKDALNKHVKRTTRR